MKVMIFNTVPYGSTGRISKRIAMVAEEYGIEAYFVCGWTRKHRKRTTAHEIIATGFFSKAIHLGFAKLTGYDGMFSNGCTKKLLRKIDNIKPDIIHLHIMHDYFINLELLLKYATLNNIQLVWTFHDCWAFTGGCTYTRGCCKWKNGCQSCSENTIKYLSSLSNVRLLMWQKKAKLSGMVNNLVVTAPSKWLADMVKDSFYADKKIEVIRNGLDLTVFKPYMSNFRKEWQLEDKYIVLGVAFAWDYRKGLDVFVELFKLLPEKFKIVLVGTDTKIDKLLPTGIISIHKTNSQAELASIYSCADVFVNPTRQEVFGMVNIEALACGTPVITFNTGGSPESIDDSCGIVVNDKTAKALINPIMEVCIKRPFSERACMNRAKLFDEQNTYMQYINLYKQLLQPDRERS